jgi:predicted Zn-dependent protease
VGLGVVHARLGQYGRAIELTRSALALEPERRAALLNLAGYLGRERETQDEAIRHAERAVRLWPGRTDAWRVLGEVRAAAGDHKGARIARERAAQLGGG